MDAKKLMLDATKIVIADTTVTATKLEVFRSAVAAWCEACQKQDSLSPEDLETYLFISSMLEPGNEQLLAAFKEARDRGDFV